MIDMMMPNAAMSSGTVTPYLKSMASVPTIDPQRHREHDRRQDRTDVALEEVGAHAGHVADVVTDVVGDDGGVARIVLGDTGLDLADEVGADVGGLRVDAAADTREERDRAGTHGEAVDDLSGLQRIVAGDDRA